MSQENSNLDINSTHEVVCEECNNNTFKPVFFIRKLSRFLSPDGQERIIPIDSLSCDKCGHVNKDFIPVKKENEKQIETNRNTIK